MTSVMLDFCCPRDPENLALKLGIVSMKPFLNKMINTALTIFSVMIYSLSHILLENPKGIFSNLLLEEIISNNFLNHSRDVLVSTTEIFIELLGNHLPKLLSLLNCLSFLNC